MSNRGGMGLYPRPASAALAAAGAFLEKDVDAGLRWHDGLAGQS